MSDAFLPRRDGARARPVSRFRLCLELLEDRSLLNGSGLSPVSFLPEHPFTSTEIMAGLRSGEPLTDLARVLHSASSTGLAGLIDLAASRVLFGRTGNFTVQVALRTGSNPLEAVRQLQALPFVAWAAPNFVYHQDADPREYEPNDPRYTQQYHHPLMQNDAAWDYSLGNPHIVVAVTDDGVDLYHEDLYENIWINLAEIPLTRAANLTDINGDEWLTFGELNDPINQGPYKANDVNGDGRIDARDLLAPMEMDQGIDLGGGGWANGIDDGENGYVDDLVGWDTSQRDNNPHPNGSASHGTHVAGITAAGTDNGLGVAGTAANVTIMPIRFYGSGAWTSAIIAESYAYAANNGARIITTSYNVDGFANDPTFIAGLQYMYDSGVLHFNSGGNNSQADSPRQRLDHTLYVCSTNSTDRKSGFSNWGYGMDLCAPGESILSTLRNNTYGLNSGTSMASPNAAGVAALIWSIVPDWTREEVVTALLGTCDNIDDQNPTYAGRLGCGRANSYRALTENVAPPRFRRVNGLPDEGGSTTGQIRTFQVDLASVFMGDTIHDMGNWDMREVGADGEFDTADDVLYALTLNTTAGTPYMIGTNRLYFTLEEALPPGAYRFLAVSGGLLDPYYQPLDGDGDGVWGDHFLRHFYVLSTAPDTGRGSFAGAEVIAPLLGGARRTAPAAQPAGLETNLPPLRIDTLAGASGLVGSGQAANLTEGEPLVDLPRPTTEDPTAWDGSELLRPRLFELS